MEDIKNNKRKKIIIIGIIFIFLLATIGVTFAYFSSRKSTEHQEIGTGHFSIAYLKGSENTINLTNAIPIREDEIFEKASKIEFKVTNDGDYDAVLRLDLVNINMSANLGTRDMYWALYQDSTLLNKGWFGCETELVNEKQTILKGANLGKSLTNTYQLYVYVLENDKDQSSMMNGTLSANIQAIGGDGEYKQTYNDLSLSYGICPKPRVFMVDTSGANTPDLIENSLIPVAYDGGSKKWYKTTTDQTKWYNYDNQEWANAVTVSQETRNNYINAKFGTEVKMHDIETMWVWIPRYNYDTTNLGNNYAGGTKEQPGEIKVNFIDSAASSIADNNYTHPAFTFGEKKLTAMWIAKFEMSSDCLNNPSTKSSENCTRVGGGLSTSEKALIKPNMKSWRENVVHFFFEVSKTISASNNTYGISENADSHIMKNTEWGAVAYLSQSKYGKYGNSDYTGANKEIYKNNSSNWYTGRSSGFPPGSGSSANGTYEYDNPINGTGASTTGNIYGIYDMSGGADEYVMGNYNNTADVGGFTSTWFNDINNNKYYDKYTSTTVSSGYIKGDATYETSEWYNDNAYFVNSRRAWFFRGGSYYNNSNVGVFYYHSLGGGAFDYASRPSLVH